MTTLHIKGHKAEILARLYTTVKDTKSAEDEKYHAAVCYLLVLDGIEVKPE